MPAVRQHISFVLNGSPCEVAGENALLTVSEYLRQRRGLIGVKTVCSEGDCGSCSVLVGRVDGDAVRYLPIDSCIQFVFQLDGAHLVTVEGLADKGSLSAVQQSMVGCHGSQCGFCTPGFVVAMTGLLEASGGEGCGDEIDDHQWREGLSGNLCRCTGYTQILEAGQRAASGAWSRLAERYPDAPVIANAAACKSQPFHIAGGAAAERTSNGLLTNGQRSNGQPAVAAPQVYSPIELRDALQFRQEQPGCTVVAGATDLGVQRNKGRRAFTTLLDLSRLAELRQMGETHAGANGSRSAVLQAGAMVTWTELLAWCREHLTEFGNVLTLFGSPQIRHAGTLGGNIVNASPIADSLPLLHVMNARLRLQSTAGAREVDINDFYRGYKQLDLQPTELLTRVDLPLPSPQEKLRLYKVSRRKDMDISTFTAAVRMRLEGDTIADAGLAFGAVGPTVLRLPETEAMLAGRVFSAETMRDAGDVATQEITPLSDVRGSSDYRYQLARNVLLRFHAEQQPGAPAAAN
ncbi:MAG: FAD binding domain-containing protein [Planctomycetota bacterium]